MGTAQHSVENARKQGVEKFQIFRPLVATTRLPCADARHKYLIYLSEEEVTPWFWAKPFFKLLPLCSIMSSPAHGVQQCITESGLLKEHTWASCLLEEISIKTQVGWAKESCGKPHINLLIILLPISLLVIFTEGYEKLGYSILRNLNNIQNASFMTMGEGRVNQEGQSIPKALQLWRDTLSARRISQSENQTVNHLQ